jgi:CRP-like cAMP-binding protein
MPDPEKRQMSLTTRAARNLATETKSVPQMQGISSRWLLRILPWVQVSGGTYRLNRRLCYPVGDGRVSFSTTGATVEVIPASLLELPALRGFQHPEVLATLAGRFTQREVPIGEVLAEAGRPAERLGLIAHGKANKLCAGKYGDQAAVAVLADGDHLGSLPLLASGGNFEYTVKAITPVILMELSREQLLELLNQSAELRAQLEHFQMAAKPAQNKHGEAAMEITAGHEGEPKLAGTFADYETSPREYPLSVAQTILRVHTRVADLYNDPMNQTEQQLRLTVEELRERQEDEMINNREFGLLHNADLRQRMQTRGGPPTPDDLDELLAAVRDADYFLAHPKTIAAFGRECNRRGLYPGSVEKNGNMMPAWRGVPILTCNKIPINDARMSSILVMRTGQEDQGVIGLHQTGIPDEYQPSLSVRFMGIDEHAIISYLVSVYYSLAVLVPDALAILENVAVCHAHD